MDQIQPRGNHEKTSPDGLVFSWLATIEQVITAIKRDFNSLNIT